MNFTLDDIKAAAKEKYGSTTIDLGNGETVELLNALRLEKGKRKRLIAVQNELDGADDDFDQEASIDEMLSLLCANDWQRDRLMEAVGDDLAVKVEIMASYGKVTQVGEASPSQS